MKSSPALVAALRSVLRPLVRLLVARGVTYPMLLDLLKQTYVEAAQRHFGAATDSRITLLTGVHRKDVRRFREEEPAPENEMPETVALGAQLVATWIERFRDAKGRPLPLARLQADGGARSFEALVTGVSTDIRPRAVLDAWLRLGVVKIDKEDRVVLANAAFVPSRGFDEKAFYLGLNVGDHAAAAAHNLIGEGVPFLERSVHYDALDPASVADLVALGEQTGMTALKAVNQAAMKAEARDEKKTAPKQRITFGMYFYAQPTDAP